MSTYYPARFNNYIYPLIETGDWKNEMQQAENKTD